MKTISIIGGDLRIAKLTEMLAKDKYEIFSYAMEKYENIAKIENIKQCNSLNEAVENSNLIIGPIPLINTRNEINTPLSDNNITVEEFIKSISGRTLIAGSIKEEFSNIAKNNQIKIIDLLKKEELTILNTISTAEGTIQIAMEETTKTIYGSNILILGFGRVGKTLADRFKSFGAKIFCEARKESDLAWIKTYGYIPIHLNKLDESLNEFDIIINTIPQLILGEEQLRKINSDSLIIDLASRPGGVDFEYAKQIGIKTIWALALPGKVAPTTSAEFIKETLYNIFEKL